MLSFNFFSFKIFEVVFLMSETDSTDSRLTNESLQFIMTFSESKIGGFKEANEVSVFKLVKAMIFEEIRKKNFDFVKSFEDDDKINRFNIIIIRYEVIIKEENIGFIYRIVKDKRKKYL